LIGSTEWLWMAFTSYALLFAALFVALRPLLQLLPRPRRRWKSGRWGRKMARRDWPVWFLRLCRLSDPVRLAERGQLLAAAGIPASLTVVQYELLRRAAGLFFLILGSAGGIGCRRPELPLPVSPVCLIVFSLAGGILLVFDRTILAAARKQRTYRIVREIHVLSNQLLYYSGSGMNLHSKLGRCLPYTRALRRSLQLMLNEWYQDPDAAIRRFKRSLGTDEAHSFAETLQALRLGESETFYRLLRERIRDYKEKLELAKDSRKETVSYVLFVIAGLPIMNTIRVFIYPWVMEGQKLFQSLN